ncbi:preprotein translocase [Priestia taiwanensis]|uniref:Uncharacterized protein n=1 Tax=Priestia taiwanensis TaxID=1347902 RepID=A0A917AIN6_9BACI|nr:preprotein translocase [Priestia taiwanensis]MBM7361681.1 hypothetical protein [Priestia taiwanensis]GGE56144.1 hypothetical protein GCM10007140_03060 [Priestia taiwanensis]
MGRSNYSAPKFYPQHEANCPAYGTFWQTAFITVPFGGSFPFNQVGRSAGGICITNTDLSVIRIPQAGDYRVSFIATINTTLNPVFPHIPVISIYVNGARLANAQGDFNIQINDPDDTGCHQLVGEAIVYIPANSTLRLVNNSFFNDQSIVTCDNGINAVELTIIKVS